jgi:hypothetical protein
MGTGQHLGIFITAGNFTLEARREAVREGTDPTELVDADKLVTMFLKKRKLKKWNEYKDKIPVAWRFYQREIRRGVDMRKAELKAVKLVYPGDKNSSTTLNIWWKYLFMAASLPFLPDTRTSETYLTRLIPLMS